MTTPNASASNGFSIGNAYGTVTIDSSSAISSLNRLKTHVQGFASGFQRIGSQISSFGSSFTQMMAPFTVGMGAGIKAAGSFQDSLAEIQARTGLTEEAMESVRKKALELGADTKFSTIQASQAFLQLTTAGLTYEQAMAAITPVLNGAAAANMDLGTAADIATNVMSAFGMKAEDVTDIMQAMSAASASSPASMLEMGEALQLIGGDAQSFGLTLDQTSAALAILAQNGKRGSEAANQLKSMFTSMASETPKTLEAWDMVNSQLFDAQGNSRDFAVVLAEVKAGLQNLNAEEQAFVIQQLAGSYGRTGFNALLASEGIEAMNDTMSEQADFMEVAEARMNTFMGQITSLRGSIESLLITAFMPFIEAMTPFVKQVIAIVNSITAWIDANQAMVQPMLRVITMLIAAGPVIFGFGKALTFVGFLIGSLVSPLHLLMLAGTALVAAWTADFAGLQTRLQPIFGSISNLIRFFARDIREYGLGEAFKAIFGQGSFAEGMESSLEGLLITLGFSRERAVAMVTGIWNAISPMVTWFGRMQNMFAHHGLTRGLQLLFTTFEDGSSFIGLFFEAFGMGETRAQGFAATVNQYLLPVINTGITIVRAFSNSFRVFRTSLESGMSITKAFGDSLMTFAANLGVPMPRIIQIRSWLISLFSAINVGWTTARTALTAFTNGVSGLWTAVRGDGLTGGANYIRDNLVQPLITGVQSINWGQVATAVMTAIASAFSTVVTWATWVYDNILLPVFNNAQAAIETVNWGQVGYSLMSAIGTAITTTFDFVSWLVSSIFTPLTGNAEAGTAGVDWSQVGNAMMNALGSFFSGVFDFVGWILETIVLPFVTGAVMAIAQADWGVIGTGIFDAIANTLPNIAQWVTNNIINPIKDSLANFNPMNAVQGVGDATGNALSTGFNNIKSFFNTTGAALAAQSAPQYAKGTNFVPRDMLAMLHKGEAVVPRQFNPAANNMSSITNNNTNNNAPVIEQLVIHAGTYEAGREAARGFNEEFYTAMKSSP